MSSRYLNGHSNVIQKQLQLDNFLQRTKNRINVTSRCIDFLFSCHIYAAAFLFRNKQSLKFCNNLLQSIFLRNLKERNWTFICKETVKFKGIEKIKFISTLNFINYLYNCLQIILFQKYPWLYWWKIISVSIWCKNYKCTWIFVELVFIGLWNKIIIS